MKRIFISSVQKEFADERRLLKRYISKNPAYKRLFDTFVFEEDVVATDRRTDQVYLDELGRCDIYIGLIGNEYGYEDAQGVSPTEREYDEATRLGLTRLVFVLNKDDSKRQPKEAAFLRKISADLIRAKCDDSSALLLEIYSSLEGLLVESGAYRMGPFDASVCDGATINDIDADKVSWFVRKAREIRNADIDVDMPAESVLSHLRLFSGKSGGLTNAAILLFGKNPQRFLISSEVKCAQWYGTERHKPILSYQIYKGTLFDMADAAVSFVLSKLDLKVGTRSKDIYASREYEIPVSVVAEAIINAIAHRDYASTGSVQVEVFSDRFVVRNPGALNPAITKEELFEDHTSYPNNSLIADQLYQTKHIEKFGTGFTDMVNDCRKAGLKDPEVDDSRNSFTVTVWRPEPEKITAVDSEGIANKKQKREVNDAEIIAQIQLYPHLSVARLANKLQISQARLRARLDSYRHDGVLTREGAKKNGRWVLTDKFGGCDADGNLVVRIGVPIAQEVAEIVQKIADAREVPLDIAAHEILAEEIHKDKRGK